ncbi:hypothetical protein BDR07DRAFT_106930 [Suillus spraguei]|nr:hypothetical protein BDR07DRAFT_106930 [Suillus spraguei]
MVLGSVERNLFAYYSKQVNRLAISPDKRLLAAAIHKKVYIYEITSTSSTPLTCLDAHTNNVTSVSFHSEGKWLVTGSEDGTIRIWDLRSTQVHRTESSYLAIKRVALSNGIYPKIFAHTN